MNIQEAPYLSSQHHAGVGITKCQQIQNYIGVALQDRLKISVELSGHHISSRSIGMLSSADTEESLLCQSFAAEEKLC